MADTVDLELSHIIHACSRKDLLKSGDLIDITDMAREAGFSLPLAISRAAWANCVDWPEDALKRKGAIQDEQGRLWDVVFMARVSASENLDTDRFLYRVYRIPVKGRQITPEPILLALHIGPGDKGEPVLTILMPDED